MVLLTSFACAAEGDHIADTFPPFAVHMKGAHIMPLQA